MKCKNDFISLRSETFSGKFGISCCVIRFKCSLVTLHSFLSAHFIEIPEVTGDYCRYFVILKGIVSM